MTWQEKLRELDQIGFVTIESDRKGNYTIHLRVHKNRLEVSSCTDTSIEMAVCQLWNNISGQVHRCERPNVLLFKSFFSRHCTLGGSILVSWVCPKCAAVWELSEERDYWLLASESTRIADGTGK